MSSNDIRETLLEVIAEQTPKDRSSGTLQFKSILDEASKRLRSTNNIDMEQAILTQFYELFRTGYLAWGHNITNPGPPFCHLTYSGLLTLDRLSRDPGNPDGYIRHLYSIDNNLNPVAKSYLEEALNCYASSFYKAAAVMLGAASESIILVLRDVLVDKMNTLGRPTRKNLSDWRIKTIIDELEKLFESEKKAFHRELREEYEAYWRAFTQQIRATRNEAGHPVSVEPITEDAVHAAFLVFTELVKLEYKLNVWVKNDFRGDAANPES